MYRWVVTGACCALLVGSLTVFGLMHIDIKPAPPLVVLDARDWTCTMPIGELDSEGRLECNQFTAKGVKP